MRRHAVVFLAAIVGMACDKHSATTNPPAPSAATPPAPTTEATEAEDPTEAALIKIDHLSWLDAFLAVKPAMVDTPDEDSPGSSLFALWAARRMRWNDVSVPNDETTFALVKKDALEQLGKRMCSSGNIIEIHADHPNTGGELTHGILQSDSGHLYRFMAAGSSGDLVEQSYCRLCGVVTGNYDYSNSAGGTSHAVAVVGMFDLPRNKLSPGPKTVSVSDLPRVAQ